MHALRNSTDAESAFSGFVAYRTITLPFFTAGSSIFGHKTGLSLMLQLAKQIAK